MRFTSVSLLLGVILSGCTGLDSSKPPALDVKPSLASGYQPLNPRTVWLAGDSPNLAADQLRAVLLRNLPNEAVRFAVAHIQADGSISFAPIAVSAKGEDYPLVIDYIKYITMTRYVRITCDESGIPEAELLPDLHMESYSPTTYPVTIYVGVGFRIQADIEASEAGLNLSSLIGIGAAAQTNQVAGTLTIQTLGITGEEVSSSLALPNELSIASIQVAIQDLSVVKSHLYDDGIVAFPQIVAFESPVGRPKSISTVRALVSSMDLSMHVMRAEKDEVGEDDYLYLDWKYDSPETTESSDTATDDDDGDDDDADDADSGENDVDGAGN